VLLNQGADSLSVGLRNGSSVPDIGHCVIKGREFLDQPSDCQIVRKDSVLCI
jgi:hypothetical protein